MAFVLSGCAVTPAPDCAVSLHVLGTSQDGGAPQLANPDDPGWTDPAARGLATSLALTDARDGRRYLFEATPDMREQLQQLDQLMPVDERPGIDGIFLTHAHMGHYTGLMFLGFESIGADGVPVYAMPRMREYLRSNGPWSQLVEFGNIELRPLAAGQSVSLVNDVVVTPLQVPHRGEYSETVGFLIAGPARRALFIPDLDSWDEWAAEYDQHIEDWLTRVDIAYLDATFFDDNELPGRDMSAIPHPRIAAMMNRFDTLPPQVRSRVRFVHMNHTNPARYPDGEASADVAARGYRVARRGETECLSLEGSP